MHIIGSELHLAAKHHAVTEQESRQQLRVWVGDPPDRPLANESPSALGLDTVELSLAARESQPTKEQAVLDYELSAEDQLKIQLLRRMFEALTGKAFEFNEPGAFSAHLAAQGTPEPLDIPLTKEPPPPLAAPVEARRPLGYGIEFDRYERHYESERTSFTAQGQVMTADGQKIEIAVELNMSPSLKPTLF